MLALDAETALIRRGCAIPRPVCVTWARPGLDPKITHAADAEHHISSWLNDSSLPIVGHNVAYDMAVLGERFPSLKRGIFKAYADDRVTDTMWRQKMLDISGGVYRGLFEDGVRRVKYEYTLEALAYRCAGIIAKKEGFRLFYGAFEHVPLARWVDHAKTLQERGRIYLASPSESTDPELSRLHAIIGKDFLGAKGVGGMVLADPREVITYPLEDARATLAVYTAQSAHRKYLFDEFRQARAYWALHLSSAWGIRTNPDDVKALRGLLESAYAQVEARLVAAGLVRPNGTRDTAAAKALMESVCREAGLPIRRTDAGQVSLDSEACKATGNPLLEDYAELSVLKKGLSNDLKMLESATVYPAHTRYDIVETGRSSSSNPNIQNLRRLVGIREAFTPRAGWVFGQADYPQLELYALAQCCVSWFGESSLADALNGGLDAHTALAARLLRISYEEASTRLEAGDVEVKDTRHLAKVLNFGLPGGLGPETFLEYAKRLMKPEMWARLALTEERAEELKAEWITQWPEMQLHFLRVNKLMDPVTKRGTVESLFTKRIRGGVAFCAACNSGFQGLGADCAKNAAWLIAHAQYNEPKSPLFNTRTVAFVHDEFVLEIMDNDRAHDAAMALADTMVNGANAFLPDVPIPRAKLKPLLMRKWSKDAKPVIEKGRLIPWAA